MALADRVSYRRLTRRLSFRVPLLWHTSSPRGFGPMNASVTKSWTYAHRRFRSGAVMLIMQYPDFSRLSRSTRPLYLRRPISPFGPGTNISRSSEQTAPVSDTDRKTVVSGKGCQYV